MEDYSRLIAAGVPADAPGTYGENLLTEGLDYKALRPGDHLHLSGGVKLEIFDIREPCVTLQQLDPRFPDLLIGRSGFLCRVLQGGGVATGEQIRLDTSDAKRRAPLSQG
jgi:MOSC domain-containing protein YiiM